MKWKEWLDKWSMTSVKLSAGFAELEFSPKDPDRDAAWELYVELLTRISTQHLQPDHGDDKTALYFEAVDRPGALVEILEAFSSRSLNMTFIQSRPSRSKSFDYAFFVDLLGHRDEELVGAAVAAAVPHCSQLRILGSFPRSSDIL